VINEKKKKRNFLERKGFAPPEEGIQQYGSN
jgi:hypothetical protein